MSHRGSGRAHVRPESSPCAHQVGTRCGPPRANVRTTSDQVADQVAPRCGPGRINARTTVARKNAKTTCLLIVDMLVWGRKGPRGAARLSIECETGSRGMAVRTRSRPGTASWDLMRWDGSPSRPQDAASSDTVVPAAATLADSEPEAPKQQSRGRSSEEPHQPRIRAYPKTGCAERPCQHVY